MGWYEFKRQIWLDLLTYGIHTVTSRKEGRHIDIWMGTRRIFDVHVEGSSYEECYAQVPEWLKRCSMTWKDFCVKVRCNAVASLTVNQLEADFDGPIPESIQEVKLKMKSGAVAFGQGSNLQECFDALPDWVKLLDEKLNVPR